MKTEAGEKALSQKEISELRVLNVQAWLPTREDLERALDQVRAENRESLARVLRERYGVPTVTAETAPAAGRHWPTSGHGLLEEGARAMDAHIREEIARAILGRFWIHKENQGRGENLTLLASSLERCER